MKRLLLGTSLLAVGLFCLHANAQLNVYFPGPGGHGAGCTPNTQGGGTDANVIGLWHFDSNGNDTSQGGLAGRNLSLAGTANYSSTQKKFGPTSLGIGTTAASTSVASFPSNNMRIYPNQDFTIEVWQYLVAAPGYWGIFGNGNNSMVYNNAPPFYINVQDQLQGGPGGGALVVGSQTAAAAFTLNTWHHIAFERQGSNTNTAVGRLFIDGVEVPGSPSTAVYNPYIPSQAWAGSGAFGTSGGTWTWGRASASFYFLAANNFLDEGRISNIARYNGNFTPQTSAFCDPATTYQGPGDSVANAKAWWGTRAYSQNYLKTNAKLVNVRNSALGVTCDLMADYFTGRAANTLNCSTASYNGMIPSDFCNVSGSGANQCFVTKAYDQSGALQCAGAACDASQATAGNQPPYVFNCFGNTDCIAPTAATQVLVSGAGPALTAPFSVSGIASRTGAFTTASPFYQQTTTTQFLFNTTNNSLSLKNTTTSSNITATDSVIHAVTGIFNGASSSITVDGANTAVSGVGSGATSGAFTLGGYIGQLGEVGVWGSDLTASASTLCTSQYNAGWPGSTCASIPTSVACVIGPPTSGAIVMPLQNTRTTISGNNAYTIGTNGSIICPAARQVRTCLIGGGGNTAGSNPSGSGGAGGMVFASPYFSAGVNNITPGGPGANTVALGITALLGGTGGTAGDGSTTPGGAGGSGGSGGGGGYDTNYCSSPGCGAGGLPVGPNAHAGYPGTWTGTVGVGGGGGGAGQDAQYPNIGGNGKACPLDSIVYSQGGGAQTMTTQAPGNGFGQRGQAVFQEVAAPAGTWHQINAAVPSFSNQTGLPFAVGVYRPLYKVASYNAGLSSGTWLRLTLSASAASGVAITGLGPFFVGHPVSAGSSDFQGDQVQVTFNGGSPTINLPASGSVVSDPVYYSWTPTKDTMVGIYFNNSTQPTSAVPGNTAAGTTLVASNNPASSGSGSGQSQPGQEVVSYTMNNGYMFWLSKIEVNY